MDKAQELLPCPMCAGTDGDDNSLRVAKAGLWRVECTCGASWSGAMTEAEAIAGWNTRAATELDAVKAENARLREALEALAQPREICWEECRDIARAALGDQP